MRPHPNETQAIRQVLLDADPQGRIYLFGSRTNDAGRGGDIDVFLILQKYWRLKHDWRLNIYTSLKASFVDICAIGN